MLSLEFPFFFANVCLHIWFRYVGSKFYLNVFSIGIAAELLLVSVMML